MSATITQSVLGTLSSTPSTTAVGAQANDPQMNQFLTLLTAQLKNQDPTSPTDPTQFVSQLAQFSTVEQLVQSNSSLSSISHSISGLSIGQYAGLIGHTVGATTTSVTAPPANGSTDLGFDVTTPALANVQVQVTNAAGTVVRSIAVSGSSGNVSFDGLDGNGQPLPAGQYGIALVGSAAQGGALQSAGALTSAGTVAGVAQATDGTWQLQLSNGTTVPAASLDAVQ